ncbi:virion structural protein [Acinetobacter phage vB_AbaM_KissB]|uniref:virion structural protein n=1 Tax=Acinetobacter phage vB_AbaM_phiAbaA1 TaxID=1605379 RepID=UPI00078CFA1E|nr:virion structural protein [Acinetobacter phage vB_AbaM_phiAbaA1]AJK27144.1 hypothetical protein phiAbaA1_041 [Acinetobacter phage vB_AbaM_phiAbaA1]
MSISLLDPNKLSLTILGCKVEGFSQGSFVTMEKETPTFKTKKSLKGSKLVERDIHSDYQFVFRLDNTAGANTWLHAIYKLQEAYGIIFPVPIIYKDMNGVNSFFCPSAILQEPRVEQGGEVYPTEWSLICPKAVTTIGGSAIDDRVAKTLQMISTFVQAASLIDIDMSSVSSIAESIKERATSAWGNLF